MLYFLFLFQIECEIPAGLKAGDTFEVQANGISVFAIVPIDSSPNETIRVTVPNEITCPSKPSTSSPSTHDVLCDVQVPAGLNPGDTFQVEVNGSTSLITVPPGVIPGQTLRVSLSSPDPIMR